MAQEAKRVPATLTTQRSESCGSSISAEQKTKNKKVKEKYRKKIAKKKRKEKARFIIIIYLSEAFFQMIVYLSIASYKSIFVSTHI